jgi:hypothetical protein
VAGESVRKFLLQLGPTWRAGDGRLKSTTTAVFRRGSPTEARFELALGCAIFFKVAAENSWPGDPCVSSRNTVFSDMDA